jgi:hypothetical protein
MANDERGDASPHIHSNARVLAVLAIGLVQVGCVTIEEPTPSAQPREQSVHRTGSRLPSSAAPVETVSKDAWLNDRREPGAAPDRRM